MAAVPQAHAVRVEPHRSALPRIVGLGGGTGLPVLLQGLRCALETPGPGTTVDRDSRPPYAGALP
jgi:hypothetical protein